MSYFLTKPSLILPFLLTLGACSSSPFIEDWDRERISSIDDAKKMLQVSVCFDKDNHPREQVYQVARDECAQRIQEIETLKQHQASTEALKSGQSAISAMEGPVKKQARIDAMIRGLKLGYISNDVWDCPLLTPNRIVLACQYDPQAQDSIKKRPQNNPKAVDPELPPELPDDLKPQ